MATKVQKPQYTKDDQEQKETVVLPQQPIPSEDIKELVERVDIETLKLWKGNTRVHTGANIKKLAGTIQVHGQQQPVVAWRKNRTIYIGNGRYLAIKALGWKYIDVKWADFQNEAEAEAAGTANNRSHEWSEWDFDALKEQFRSEELTALVGGKERFVEFTGFSAKEIDKIMLKGSTGEGSASLPVKAEPNMAVIRIACPIKMQTEFITGLRAYLNGKGWTSKGVKIV